MGDIGAHRRSGGPRLHILQVYAPGAFGGLETVVRDLATALVARGHRVSVLATANRVPDWAPEGPSRRLAVHAVEPGLRGVGRAVRAFRGLAAECDVVHTHGYRSDLLHGPLARPGAVVSTVHGFTGGGGRLALYTALQLRALRDCPAVVAVSRPLARQLEDLGIGPSRIRTIPNTRSAPEFRSRVEARARLGLGEGFTYGWVGRMSREKRPGLAIEAFHRLPEASESRLVLIGDGPLRTSLEARWTGDRVHFAGAVPDAAELMRGFDALVLSSDTEGTPMVLLEAMLAGVPIVATDVGGVPDLLPEGAALLVPPGRPGRLAHAMDAVRSSKDLARRLSQAALERVQAVYDPDTWAAAYEAEYRRLLR